MIFDKFEYYGAPDIDQEMSGQQLDEKKRIGVPYKLSFKSAGKIPPDVKMGRGEAGWTVKNFTYPKEALKFLKSLPGEARTPSYKRQLAQLQKMVEDKMGRSMGWAPPPASKLKLSVNSFKKGQKVSFINAHTLKKQVLTVDSVYRGGAYNAVHLSGKRGSKYDITFHGGGRPPVLIRMGKGMQAVPTEVRMKPGSLQIEGVSHGKGTEMLIESVKIDASQRHVTIGKQVYAVDAKHKDGTWYLRPAGAAYGMNCVTFDPRTKKIVKRHGRKREEVDLVGDIQAEIDRLESTDSPFPEMREKRLEELKTELEEAGGRGRRKPLGGRGLQVAKPKGGRGLGPGGGKGPYRGTGLGPGTGECARTKEEIEKELVRLESINSVFPEIREKRIAELKAELEEAAKKGEKRTYQIKRSFMEGGQRGHIVGIVTTDGKKIDLVVFHDKGGADAAYDKADKAEKAIRKGNFTNEYNNYKFVVKGKTLTATKL